MTETLEFAAERPTASAVSKVAAITLTFWVLKIVTTSVGDVCGDVLSMTLGLGYARALVVAAAAILALLAVQIRAGRFMPWLFWLLILLSSTVGAEVSDFFDRGLHLGYIAGAALLLAATLVAAAAWRARLGRVVLYPVRTRRHEAFYWATAILANSLGSVMGDLFGDRLGLGLIGGIAINAAILGALLLLHYRTRLPRPWLFWTAFVFSRI